MNFSRQIEVCQNKVNKSDNFSRQIEVCQIVNWNYKAKLTIFDGKNYERKIRLFLKGVFGFFEILKLFFLKNPN